MKLIRKDIFTRTNDTDDAQRKPKNRPLAAFYLSQDFYIQVTAHGRLFGKPSQIATQGAVIWGGGIGI